MAYATKTSVSVEKTRMQIEKLLAAAGAKKMGSATDEEQGMALLTFDLADRTVAMRIPLPKAGDRAIALDHRRRPRPAAKAREAWEQACRSRWRGAFLLVKAKLEAVEAGMSTIEREFLADVRMADGRTVGQMLVEIGHGERGVLLLGSGS